MRLLNIDRGKLHSPRRARLGTARGKTIAIPPRRVDGLSDRRDKTLAIALPGELVARIGGVAWKGAAELAVAPDERDL
jgi:hypothetical protein